eukprot:TRINITY_DN5056_c0_g1_i3.p1 TRINITY_DN5056_c0_g1~~TRINITY_DN5056_c0_g1_i3.p1  ORF type:complete len:447 (-),score=56.00 TRINITY_DN5056_c0_g1_i3:765-2105(-)
MPAKGTVKCPVTGEYVHPLMIWPEGRPGSAQHRVDTPEPKVRVKAVAGQGVIPKAQAQVEPGVISEGQAVASKAKAKAKRRPRPSLSERVQKLAWFLWRRAKHLSSLGCLVTIVAVGTGKEGPIGQFTRILTTVADVSNSLGHAASLVLDSSSGATASATSALAALSSSTLSSLDATWHGIDLYNVSGGRAVGKLLLDDPQRLNQWLFSVAGRAATRCNNSAALHFFAATANNTGLMFPAAESSTSALSLAGHFWEAWCSSRLTASGHVLFMFSYAEVSFAAAWANPLWALLELNPESERQQIQQLLQQFVEDMPVANVSWGTWSQDLTDESLELWCLRKGRLWAMSLLLSCSYWVEFWATSWGLGLICCLLLLGILLRLCLQFSSKARQGFLQALSVVHSAFNMGHKALLCPLGSMCMSLGAGVIERTSWAWDFGFHLIVPAETT